MIEKVEGEVVDKSYKEIVEEVKRKLTNALRYDRLGKRDELVILMPEKDYNTVLDAPCDVFGIRVMEPNLFGVKLKSCQVDKIYVAFDPPEGRY